MPPNMPSGASVYLANKRADPNFKFKKPLVVLSKATSPSSVGMSNESKHVQFVGLSLRFFNWNTTEM